MTVHEAREIPTKERGGAQHSQVRLMLLPTRKTKHRTKIRSGDDNPKFEETFTFKVPPGQYHFISTNRQALLLLLSSSSSSSSSSLKRRLKPKFLYADFHETSPKLVTGKSRTLITLRGSHGEVRLACRQQHELVA